MPIENHANTRDQLIFIAHDLRNILNRIHGLNRLLAGELEKTANHTVTELLNLTLLQCETGIDFTTKMIKQHQESRFMLNDLLTELYLIYQYPAKEKDIIFTLHLPDSDLYIDTERSKLIRILDNLLNNSIKFTPRNGKVSMELFQQGNKTVIAISDTGIGIPENHHHLLFSKSPEIRRLGTENEPSGGLGLHICKLMADELNVEIDFKRNVSEGSTFFVKLNMDEKTDLQN